MMYFGGTAIHCCLLWQCTERMNGDLPAWSRIHQQLGAVGVEIIISERAGGKAISPAGNCCLDSRRNRCVLNCFEQFRMS